jgi:DNA primase
MSRDKGRFLRHVLCPFHEEDTPSCAIYDNSTYYCFACLKYGRIDELGKLKEPTKEQLILSERIRESATQTYKEIAYLTGNDYFKLNDVNYELYAKLNKNLGDRIEYFLGRGLTEDAINYYQLGWTGTKYTIPIKRKGRAYSIKFRRSEENTWDIKYSMIRGTTISLFGLDEIYFDKRGYMILTEGELDCISLCQYGFPAITSIGGCNGYKKEWKQKFPRKELYILFDNDEPGQIAAENVRQMYPNSTKLALPHEYKDVNDMLVKAGPKHFVRYFRGLNQ